MFASGRGGSARLGSLIGLVVAGAFAACGDETLRATPFLQGLASSAAVPELVGTPPAIDERACLQRIERALTEDALPGVPEFEARRAEILARAKGVPVLLAEAPEPSPGLSEPAARARQALDAARAQATTLYSMYPRLVRDKALARQVLLTDGYLFARTPSLAFGLSRVTRLEDLFDAERLWLERGAERQVLVRKGRGKRAVYVEEGSERRATLLFLDRVATDPAELARPLHRELDTVHRELGFDSASVRQQSRDFVVLDARYSDEVVPTLLVVEGARLELACEALPAASTARILAYRKEQRERAALIGRVRAAIDEQIDETLPFDEPRTEYGQEDGKLREAFNDAYLRGLDHYEYNDDRYWVFDGAGRPVVPQVCIDFITDTLERAAGTGYGSRDEPRGRKLGGLDFDAVDVPSRRRVQDFVGFAERQADWFELWRPERHVPLRGRKRFFAFLEQHRSQFRPGDIVIIYGPRDDGQAHYHSFFVVQSDPLTGMPIQVASNAVRPQIRSWEAEMANAPGRSIRVRVRPRSSWLAAVMDGDSRGPDPAPVGAERPATAGFSQPGSASE